MTPSELEDKLDKALDQALTLCTSASEYTALLKVAIDYYAKRRETSDGIYGKALGRGVTNGG